MAVVFRLRLSACVLVVGVLAGCDTAPVKSPPPPSVAAISPTIDKHTLFVNQLLDRADTALAMQHLSSPVTGNAYDLYQAALRVEPSSQRAAEGLKKVAAAYSNLIDECLRGRQLAAATRHWQRAKILFPADARLLAKGAEINKLRAAIPSLANPSSTIAGANQILLPAAELKAKSKAVEVQLQAIAKRVQRTDEAVLIFARNDVEGRWIYKVMRQAVGDYRIRGDIKIAGTPSIQLQQPIQ